MMFPSEAVDGFRLFGGKLSSRPEETGVLRVADCTNVGVSGSGLTTPLTILYSNTRIGESGAPPYFAVRLSRIQPSADVRIAIGLSDEIDLSESLLRREANGNGFDHCVSLALQRGFNRVFMHPGSGLLARRELSGGRFTYCETILRTDFLKDGDTIGVECDPNDNTIRFYVNDEPVWVYTDPQRDAPPHFQPFIRRKERITDCYVFMTLRGVNLRVELIDWTIPVPASPKGIR